MSGKIHTGIGFDSHPLVQGRRLVLGGVEIAWGKGLEGWSDADALTHAIIDALLGAAAMGDIGQHFPPGNPEFHNISSLMLLQTTAKQVRENGWEIGNIDATVIAERPRLRDFIDPMRQQLSKTMQIPIEDVSVKASTSNQLGFIGREEGIAVIAAVLLEKK
jgi:2-C-methyl-D-erythritol 2,4-cyclodiphosphate synthase